MPKGRAVFGSVTEIFLAGYKQLFILVVQPVTVNFLKHPVFQI